MVCPPPAVNAPDSHATARGHLDVPVLMLTTVHSAHAGRSGYSVLTDYVKGAEVLKSSREKPASGLPLLAIRVARRLAFSRWYNAGAFELEWQARRRLRAGFEGVIHSMWADHDLGFLDVLLRRSQHRLVGTFHNCPDTFRETLRYPSRLRRLAAVVLMSEIQRPYFLAAGVDPARIHVVLHGVDTGHFAPGPERLAGEFIVLSVGGYRRNFAAMRQVCEAAAGDARIRFRVVAPPAFRPVFEGLRNVQFLSGISDADLLREYQSSSCLLHVAENATANNALLEALACGRPVVAEMRGGVPEYLTPECARMTPPDDPGALVAAIRALAGDPETAVRLGIAARQRAEELDWRNIADRMRAIYATALT